MPGTSTPRLEPVRKVWIVWIRIAEAQVNLYVVSALWAQLNSWFLGFNLFPANAPCQQEVRKQQGGYRYSILSTNWKKKCSAVEDRRWSKHTTCLYYSHSPLGPLPTQCRVTKHQPEEIRKSKEGEWVASVTNLSMLPMPALSSILQCFETKYEHVTCLVSCWTLALAVTKTPNGKQNNVN